MDSLSVKALQDYFRNKKILVTGAAGSIGYGLLRILMTLDVKEVRALDIDETRLARLKRNIKDDRLDIILADIKNKESLFDALVGVDIVYHAAALKHVPFSEFFPYEYIKTNVIGTQNLIEASIANSIDKFILISTDKAVNPTNVMGATKLLAERLTIAANLLKGNKKTKFSCVRFGNVLYTRGSVLEIFLDQIKKGQELTITDPNMTRFIMDIDDAVKLILKATAKMKGGEIFILKMPAVKIKDLAEAFVDVVSEKLGIDKKKIGFKIIGRRPGEKMHEELMTEEESLHAFEEEDMFVILSEIVSAKPIVHEIPIKRYTSKTAKLLSKNEIKELLKRFFERYIEEFAF